MNKGSVIRWFSSWARVEHAKAAWLLGALLLHSTSADAQRNGTTQPAVPPRIGRAIPDLTLSTVDGHTLRPADRKGRTMVLAYVREHQVLTQRLLSDLQAEYGELKNKSIDVIAVASGDSSPAYWRDLINKQGITFPLVLDAEDRLIRSMGWKALPATAVVNGQGKVASLLFLHRASFARNLWRELRHAMVPGAEEARQQIAVAQARQTAVHKVRDLVYAGQPDKALDTINQIRKAYPDHIGTRMLLGKTLIELDRPTEAIQEFLAVEKLAPSSLRATFWRGIAYARSGKEAEARNLLTDLSAAMPDAWRAYGELGLIQHRQGYLEEASRLLRKSAKGTTNLIWKTGGGWVGSRAPILDTVDMEGDVHSARVGASSDSAPRPTVLLFWHSDDEASVACLKQLESYHGRYGEEKLAVVAVNVDKRRFSEADRARVYQSAKTAGATFPIWFDTDRETFARYDGPAIPFAVLIDGHGVVKKRVVGDDWSTLAKPLAKLTATAISVPITNVPVTSAPATSAHDPARRPAFPRNRAIGERYLAMARHLARQGNLSAAIDSARQSLSESPAPPGAAALLGRLLSASGQQDKAVELLAEATRDRPENADLYTAYADCLLGGGLTAKAQEWYRRAIDVVTGYAPAHVGLGKVLLTEGNREPALREARLAAQFNPYDARARVLLADVLASMGQLPEAVETYETAYRLRWEHNGPLGRKQ